MNRFLQKYGKAIVSFLFAVGITVWQKFSGDRSIDLTEAVVIILAFGNAALTWIVPLVPQYPWAKSAASAVIAAATVATTLVLDGIQGDDLAIILATAAQALGVKLAPAESNNGVAAPAGFTDGRTG